MKVVFHVISLGNGGSGASRVTRYISERDRDPKREGPDSRRLFSHDQDDRSYRKADHILAPLEPEPNKDDLLHFSVSLREEDFDKLGDDEKDRQARLRAAIREGMEGLSEQLKLELVTWIGGIHRNSDNPHAHIVMSKDVVELDAGKRKRLGRIPRDLLPHKTIIDGHEVIENGGIATRFREAIARQQELYSKSQRPQPYLNRAERWEQLARKHQQQRIRESFGAPEITQLTSIDQRRVSHSWNKLPHHSADSSTELRIVLGKRLEFEMRLAFAEAWHERAVNHGDTFRFEVIDQSSGEGPRISDLEVRRRAAARASTEIDQKARNQAIDRDLAQHSKTLQQLNEAREAKIDALAKDITSLRGNLNRVQQRISRTYQMPAEERLAPMLTRETLNELQQQAIKLNLSDRVGELEQLRVNLAREHKAPIRNDAEAAQLVAHLNVARADFRAREQRLENFDSSAHLTSYEVGSEQARTPPLPAPPHSLTTTQADAKAENLRPNTNLERWPLASIDKEIARRREDSKVIPKHAARLDLRALSRMNYSPAKREQAAQDVEHLQSIREMLVRKIEDRRADLIADRNSAKELLQTIENAYEPEQRRRLNDNRTMPEPVYDRSQINSLEASAETVRDANLLREVHQWEQAGSTDSEVSWEARAVAREIMSSIALEQAKERLYNFLENEKGSSLHLENHKN